MKCVRLTRVPVPAAAIVLAAAFLVAGSEDDQRRKEGEDAVLKSNSACMVCHIDFADEELTVQHRKARVTCAACHGPCLEHMDDEMAATRPDRLFGRAEVNKMCGECHGEHKNKDAVDAFLKEWYGRRRPNGQLITKDAVCTDCHGRHVRLLAPMPQAKPEAENWRQLFNGKDLTGWKPVGDAKWTVENGVLVGQQNNGQHGDILTEESYDDFELVVTFKVRRPANSGIWFRALDKLPGYQMDIVSPGNSFHENATGSLLSWGEVGKVSDAAADCLSRVTDDSILNRDGWNTADIIAVGDHIKVTLNAAVAADLHDARHRRGKIGFQVHPGERFKDMKIMVREAKVRTLGGS